MLSHFRFRNFKSYRDASLPLANLTVLIGPNASGKSNALEAIQCLYWLARGKRLNEILQNVQGDDLSIRGTIADLSYQQGSQFTLGCSLAYERHGQASSLEWSTALEDWTDLDINIEVMPARMRLIQEEISDKGTSQSLAKARYPLYRIEQQADAYGSELQVGYNNFARGGKKPRIACTDQQALFTQLSTPARFDAKHKEAQKLIPKVTAAFREALERILFLDPNPRAMRGYSFISDNMLKGDGSNLSSVLFALQEQGQSEELLHFIRSLPEQDITGISFIQTPRAEVMLQVIETFGRTEQQRDAPLLSDGSLRVLAVAAALLSAPEDSLVIIEEIDNGVHPSRAKMLLENMQRVAKRRQLQVLLTSHNPALLDNLPEEALPDVVCCYRQPDSGESCLIRLAELADYPNLIAQGPLGKLMAGNVLERFLKQPKTLEHKRQEAQDFFAMLEAE